MFLRQLDIFSDSPKEVLTPSFNTGKGNQEILDDNRAHFNGQAKLVLDHLLKGERVSGEQMHELHKIQDVRARIYSIKKYLAEFGIEVQEAKIKGGHGAKEWYLLPESIQLLSKMDLAA